MRRLTEQPGGGGLRAVAGVLALAACLPACVMPAAKYSGRVTEPVALASVSVRSGLSDDLQLLGRVTTHCHLDDDVLDDAASLSDVVCSETLLRRVLLEETARVGGTAVVAPSCAVDDDEDELTIECAAHVAQARGGVEAVAVSATSDELASPTRLAGIHEFSATELWGVRTVFSPRVSCRVARGRAGLDEVASSAMANDGVDVDRVQTLKYLAASNVVLGDIEVTCENCSTEAAAYGTRAVAASAGADAVVNVRCSERGEGVRCTALASVFEINPEREVAAR